MSKKMLIVVGAVLFLAAACNSNPPAANQTNPPPTTASAKVDAAVNAYNSGIDNEESINMQSDMDIVNSDQEVINGYNGVSNASKY